MTPQQKIIDRLYELLPHKKELEFGCEVIWTSPASEENKQKSKKYKAVVIRNWKNGAVSILENFHVNVTQSTHTILENDIEIIGQPLRLADLLVAIAKVKTKGTMYMRDDGVLFHWKKFAPGGSGNHHVESDYIEYNLSKDNILDQSDETCDFCLKLLK